MLSLGEAREARERLRGVAIRTPLVPWSVSGGTLYLKPESLQPVGSFKLRGAYNKVAGLPEEARRRGVVAHSSGNHAQAVAYAARSLGVPAVIVMPSNAPRLKRERTEAFGAEVVEVGRRDRRGSTAGKGLLPSASPPPHRRRDADGEERACGAEHADAGGGIARVVVIRLAG